MNDTEPRQKKRPRGSLKRSLNLPLLTVYGLGTILGAGIYVVVGEVASEAGALTPIAFLIAAIAAGFTALSFAELSARIPQSGGPIDYTERAFGLTALSNAVGIALAATGIVSAATIATGFVGYLGVFFDLPHWLVVTGLVLALGLVAALGIEESAWVMAVTTAIGGGGLVFVLVVTWDGLGQAPAVMGQALATFDGGLAAGLFLGAFLAFYCFIGFEDMANTAEEVRDVRRTLPAGIIIALVGALVAYALVTSAVVGAVDPDVLAGARAPLVAVVEARGWPGWPLGLASLFIIVNGALTQIIMASRILMDMGRDGRGVPTLFGRVNRRTGTPLIATASVVGAILILALTVPLKGLATATSFIILAVFCAANLSLIALKRRGQPGRVPNVPLAIPAAGAVLCLAALGGQAVLTASGH